MISSSESHLKVSTTTLAPHLDVTAWYKWFGMIISSPWFRVKLRSSIYATMAFDKGHTVWIALESLLAPFIDRACSKNSQVWFQMCPNSSLSSMTWGSQMNHVEENHIGSKTNIFPFGFRQPTHSINCIRFRYCCARTRILFQSHGLEFLKVYACGLACREVVIPAGSPQQERAPLVGHCIVIWARPCRLPAWMLSRANFVPSTKSSSRYPSIHNLQNGHNNPKAII